MKKFKKVLICAAACVTACSFTALAACSKDETPGDGLSADVTVAEAMNSEALGAQLEKLNGAQFTSFSVNGGLKLTKMGENDVDITVAEVSAKANFADGNADMLIRFNSALSGGGDAPEIGVSPQAEDGEPAEGGDEMTVMHAYLRNWLAFYPDIEGTGGGEYNYTDLAALLNESADESANTVVSNVVTVLAGGFIQDNTMLLTLANTTDSIVVDETQHTLTLNVNKMAYGLYGYIKQIVNNLTENTTLSGLLRCSAVKYYVNAYLGDMTGQELFEAVMEIVSGSIGGAGGTTPFATVAEESPLTAIMPKEGEGAYDYVMRLLDSEDVATLLGKEKPVGSFKIVDMLGAQSADVLNTIKSTVNMLDGTVISENAINIPADDGVTVMSVSNLKLVYTFDAQDTLQSVALDGRLSGEIEGTAAEIEVALNVEFPSEDITDFEVIDSYTVNVPDVGGAYVTWTVADVLKNLRAE